MGMSGFGQVFDSFLGLGLEQRLVSGTIWRKSTLTLRH